MSRKINDLAALIGETPLLKLSKVIPTGIADVYLKLEGMNIGGSTKSRIVLNSIEVAEEAGALQLGETIVEATDGNAGIAVALLAARKGYQSLLVIPAGADASLIQLLQTYGAIIVETEQKNGISGAIKEAERLCKQEGYFYLNQFNHVGSLKVHEATTGPEIIEALDGDAPDAFISTVGTGATLTGIGRFLRKKNPNVEIFAVEPEESHLLSGGLAGEHQIPGVSPAFIPPLLDVHLYNGVVRVTSFEAIEMTKRLAKEEGLRVSISSGAAVVGAVEIAKRLGRGKKVVAISAADGQFESLT